MSAIPTTTPSPVEKTRETRIGLVMYGGVSLAVYINGVAQEFYHAVQGNGLYRLIKELTDSEIVLDIASGSSAGGINGILLAYSLCNGKDFTRSTDLWRNAADIQRLLRSTAETGEPVRSVLDSEGYYQTELEAAFRMLDASTGKGEAPSPIEELDLFVTGTHMEGHKYQRVDTEGHVIDVKDYRAVFQLKYRQGRKSNFDASKNPAVHIALSKLARITSCFPGAFAPVFVPMSNIEGKSQERMSANELLQYWGNLQEPTYLIDGGVIDNKPFTHTIREIFLRTADRKIERKLYYVEPDPERFNPRGPDDNPEAPSFSSPILNSLVTIPGYESIADDLQSLATRNENVRNYNRMLQDVVRLYASREPERCGAGIPHIEEPQRSIYNRTRSVSLSLRVLEGVFRDATFENSPNLSRQRTELAREFDRQTTNATEVLRDFDVPFRLRRTFHLISYIYDLMYAKDAAPISDEVRGSYLQVLRRLNVQMDVWIVLDTAISQVLNATDYGWNDAIHNDASIIWGRVVTSLRLLLHAEGLKQHLEDPTKLGPLNAALWRRIAQCKTSLFDIPNFESILIRADALELDYLEGAVGARDAVVLRYHHFNAIDAHLFPIEWASGLGERNEINVCRISPMDAQSGFSNRDSRDKVAGETFAHFSGFFKRTWRSNDILWGRLDAVCELTETLLTSDALASAIGRAPARQRARAVLIPDDGSQSPLDRWFVHSSEAAIQRIKAWIADLTDDDPDRRQQALTALTAETGTQKSIRELLIEMSQFSILHECLPQVFDDSIREQAANKQVRRRSTRDPEKLEWMGMDVAIDQAALSALAAVGGKKLVEEMEGGRPTEESPRNSTLGQSFMTTYRVGGEGIFDGGIPPLVLADIASRAALVMKNCLVGSLSPKGRQRILSSTFYRWLIDIPLLAIRGLVVFLKTASGTQTAVFSAITGLAVLGLAIGLKWQDSILRTAGQLNFFWFAIFIVVPVVWLSVAAFQLSRSTLHRTHLTDSVRDAFVFLCTAAPLISVTMLYFGLTDLVWDWWRGAAEPVGSRDVQILMVFLYGIVPFLLSFLGGYMAVKSRQTELDTSDYTTALEYMTEGELQDVSDRLGEQHRVTPESRLDVAKALVVAAEMTNNMGKLDRAIRATSPGILD